MCRLTKCFLFAFLTLLFTTCDNNLVPRADYEAVLSRADELEGINDSLQFELSDLKMYVDYLEEENSELEEELNRIPVNEK